MQRCIYGPEHEAFRELVRSVLARDVVPHYAEWEQAGRIPKQFYRQLGELGILGVRVPERWGGAGQRSLKYSAVFAEESARVAISFGTVRVHTDIVLPYLITYGTEAQQERWLPGFASGQCMASIAMTEPGTGSDLAGMRTHAERDGSHFVLNGQKTFITGGANAGLLVVACRTSPFDATNRRAGLSLLLVDAETEGVTVGRTIKKLGLHAQDTVELFFEDVRVPAQNLLGNEGAAFEYLTHNLPEERLSIAFGAYSAAAAAIELTKGYVAQRDVFGQPLAGFQNTKFVLAECYTEVLAARALIDQCLTLHESGDLTGADAAVAKLFCTEVQGRVVDKCLQLHGGYGYTLDYPIAHLYADARVSRIYGGTSEVLKSVISKAL